MDLEKDLQDLSETDLLGIKQYLYDFMMSCRTTTDMFVGGESTLASAISRCSLSDSLQIIECTLDTSKTSSS